ncbi:MAG: hypothetical protein J6W27_00580 [Alphaproteobacteria bacterium]|nr:hypothetical protein [Alphaproteobacteria bacterium]
MNIVYDTPLPNMKDALSCYKDISGYGGFEIYNKYYPCLTTTNEYNQILQTKNYVIPKSKVLTVSGSGEQPLFFKLFGAEHITTFDISYNSYLMTKLKTIALQTFDQAKDFNKFLDCLYDEYHLYFLKNDYPNIIQKLNEHEQNYIRTAPEKIDIFYTNRWCDLYSFTDSDYKKLRDSIKSPFPFIWTDIKNLDERLGNAKFDIIYYSNICDFLYSYTVIDILKKTQKHLKPNGKICFVTNDDGKESLLDNINQAMSYDAIHKMPERLKFYLVVVQTR